MLALSSAFNNPEDSALSQAGNAVSTFRVASISEDSADRRINGGGPKRLIIHLIPMSRPEVVITPSGPAVTHSNDFTLVTSSKPAATGETLSLFATGVGPTRPGVDPVQPFSLFSLGRGQFAGRGDGKWKTRRGASRCRFP